MFNKHLFLLLLCSCAAEVLLAQTNPYTRGNSPYSRYGMGDLQEFSFVPNRSMGYAFSGTYQNVYDYNPQNPASLASLQATAFDAGFFYRTSSLTEPSTNKTARTHDGNLSHFSLAFPITRSWELEKDTLRKGIPLQWGMGLSFSPHSHVGYDVRVTRPVDNVGDVRYWYTGEGTRFRLNWGNGFRYKGFSLGANVGVVLGRVVNSAVIDFADSTYAYAYDEERRSNQFARGFVWDVGAQYRYVVKKARHKKTGLNTDWALVVGLYGHSQAQLSTTNNGLFRRYGTYYSADTILSQAETQGRITLPAQIGGGIALERNHYWRIGLNYEANYWSQYRNEGVGGLADAFMVSLGGEFSPIQRKGFETLRFRAGLFYGNDPRRINDLALEKYGITFGLNIPRLIRRGLPSVAFINLGAELGYLGNSNLIQDLYFKLNLGATINDGGWFVRRKYR
jgi:hypothetical protein